MLNRFILTASACLFGMLNSDAQNNTLSAGGSIEAANGRVEYSLGQVFFLNTDEASGSVNEGLQQPYLNEIITGWEYQEIQLEVFPNPTFQHLTLKIQDGRNGEYLLEMLNTEGKLILVKQVITNQTEIDLGNSASGIYFLNIYQNEILIKSYRIGKLI